MMRDESSNDISFIGDVTEKRQCFLCGRAFPMSCVIVGNHKTVSFCYLCIGKMKKAVENALATYEYPSH